MHDYYRSVRPGFRKLFSSILRVGVPVAFQKITGGGVATFVASAAKLPSMSTGTTPGAASASSGPHYASPTTPITPKSVSPTLVALAGWAVPGLGYVLLGQRSRGLTIMITILAMYLAGLLIAGIRVVDVPGFDKNGFEEKVDARGVRAELGSLAYEHGTWMMLSSSVITEIVAKPWYVGQFLVGPLNLIASLFSLHEASLNVPMSHARIAEIGTLYSAVAGMLNLLAIIDSANRASAIEDGADWEDGE